MPRKSKSYKSRQKQINRTDVSEKAVLEYLDDWKTHKEMAKHFNASRFVLHRRTGVLLRKGLVDYDVLYRPHSGRPAQIYKRKDHA